MRSEVAAEVREWLERAVDDLREAEHDLTATPPLVRGAVFHGQQTAEKVLKAFLAAHERPFPRTHDLDELGNAVVALDSTLAGGRTDFDSMWESRRIKSHGPAFALLVYRPSSL